MGWPPRDQSWPRFTRLPARLSRSPSLETMALVGVTDGRAAVTVAATSDMAGRVNAADLARAAVLAMGGQGAGGKADFAQGGAPDGSKAEEDLAAVRAALAG